MKRVLQNKCSVCTVTNCFIKRGCSRKRLRKIENEIYTCNYSKGKIIIYERSQVLGLHFIYHGKVKVFVSDLDDKEQIVRFAKDGDILGHRGYGVVYYPIGAVAMENTSICFIKTNILKGILFQNPKCTFLLMDYFSKELYTSEQRAKYIMQMKEHEKIAYAVWYINSVFGKKKKGLNTDSEISLLDVDLTRKEIGNLVGVRQEQVSRVLSEFNSQGILEFSGKKIIIKNPKPLLDLIQSYNEYIL